MGSYNYLGFAECSGESVDMTERATFEYGIGLGSSRHEFGLKNVSVLVD